MKPTLNEQGYVTSGIGGAIDAPEAATDLTVFRYRRVDGAWADAFPGETDENFMMSYNTLNESWALAERKALSIKPIKMEAARRIEALAWKIERATEVDAVDGTNTLAGVYAERAAIRTASNAHEDALNALTTLAEMDEFNLTGF